MALKTVLDKVIVAIRAVQDYKGASRQAISKYLKSEFQCDNATAIKSALKKGVAGGKLEQTGQSFRVAGDAPVEKPADETVVVEDAAEGEGPAAELGDEVSMNYRGTLDDGHCFDEGKNFKFTLGNKDVIKGWDEGILGMKKGGRRTLVVPPKLGYGAKGSKPDIPPHATLHFDVTLVKIA